jgi:hypothetical protein
VLILNSLLIDGSASPGLPVVEQIRLANAKLIDNHALPLPRNCLAHQRNRSRSHIDSMSLVAHPLQIPPRAILNRPRSPVPIALTPPSAGSMLLR